MKIGLVGEAPFDTKSIENLLCKRWSEGFTYITLVKRIRGSQLDDQKTKNILRREYESQKPDIVIFIRDLDALDNNRDQIALRKTYFAEHNSVVDKKGFFLLNIYEIEALLLSDLEMLNEHFNTEVNLDKAPVEIAEPKEFMRMHFKGYSELNNPNLFEKVRFKKVLDHPSFNKFINKLEKKLA